MRVGIAVALVALTGCGYAKQSYVDAELGQLRADMEAADRATAEALSARIDQNAQRIATLQNQLQQLQQEFGGRLQRMESEFATLIAFDVPVHFGFDAAEVRAEDRAVLERFAAVMKAYYPDALVTVEGFTDAAGSAAYNLRLGQRRADAVRDFLVQQGLSAAQLRSVSYGEAANRQVARGTAGGASGAEANRRVTLVVDAVAPRPAGQPSGE